MAIKPRVEPVYASCMIEPIIRGGHDLVIEGDNVIDRNYFYQWLKTAGYNGKYVALNQFNSEWIDDWVANKDNKEVKSSMLRAHPFSDENIYTILHFLNPDNPIYVVNAAIGMILIYPQGIIDNVHRDISADKNSLCIMIERWADKIGGAPLRRALLSDFVLSPDSPEISAVRKEKGHECFAGPKGISEEIYSDLIASFENNGWETNEAKIAELNDGAFKLISFHR